MLFIVTHARVYYGITDIGLCFTHNSNKYIHTCIHNTVVSKLCAWFGSGLKQTLLKPLPLFRVGVLAKWWLCNRHLSLAQCLIHTVSTCSSLYVYMYMYIHVYQQIPVRNYVLFSLFIDKGWWCVCADTMYLCATVVDVYSSIHTLHTYFCGSHNG